ncbi:Ubiquitin-like domain [Dillenia turbinata]|uniref:Ubiquitin-like domain n=1 Tax=Dillenia turbinata TaxID=194707 RepID=A0AAN8Z3K1_9MAGN
MKVAVENLTGTQFYIQVDEQAKVCDIKKEVVEKENLPIDRIVLFHYMDGRNEMMAEDERPLADYGVEDGSHIYLVIKAIDNVCTSTTTSSTTP